MATIHREKEVRTAPAELLRMFQEQVVTRPEFAALVDRYDIEGTTLTFVSSKGVSGRVEATPGLLVVDLEVRGLAVFAKSLIESKLDEALALIA
ncbi:MAG: polyhydroxyalkanoic acid system family protein [Acidobacteria bacterium]|nr:polyhydroxyalkanoic acid system family protein [Acidobacteriota bacterium]